MSFDRPLALTETDLISQGKGQDSDSWLADNIYHPFINGTGLIQVYDTLASKPVDTYKVKAAPTLSSDWCVQTLASAGGAIIPYVVAGKLTGLGLRAAGERLGLQGAAAKLATSESLAQIAGAGIYSFAQKPQDGQTRLSSALGTMAGFAAFSSGNYLLGKAMPRLEKSAFSSLALAAGRTAVGALGGLSSYESGNFVAALQGVKHQENWQERLQAMAQGGFINAVLPVVQERASAVLDKVLYSNTDRGLPVGREIKNSNLENDPDLQKLLEENPLARVKRTGTSAAEANPGDNSVKLGANDGAGTLAHELTHLRLSRMAEPFYKQISDLAGSNPAEAEKAYYALRANMEATARNVESRVQARLNGDSREAVVSAPETIGSQLAVPGKTYNEIWQGEWQMLKDNPKFRPPVEYKGLPSVVQSTADYEKWMASQIKVQPEDLAQKHADMASDPFKFMRATYYRWAETFPELLPELAGAPRVNATGDLHIDNFGTWTDKQGKLVWGINDFDEAYKLPYTNDLVRLLTSANLLMQEQHLKIGLKDAVRAVLDGYQQSLKDGGQAFVKGENNRKLFEIAKSQMPDEDQFWRHLKKQLTAMDEDELPPEALKALKTVLPDPEADLDIGQRQAGEGSLGRQRFVALSDSKENGYFAAEAKALLPSANDFAAGTKDPESHLKEILGAAVREPDPFVNVKGDWVVRSLAPNRAKVELGELSSLADETRLLYSMGYETANIHLGTKGAAGTILEDLSNRESGWLVDAVKTMTRQILSDQAAWKKAQK